jgi:hypothetical protein
LGRHCASAIIIAFCRGAGHRDPIVAVPGHVLMFA